MKHGRQQGLTLIEMLVAISVMTVVLAAAYASVREGLKLQKDLNAQATWLVDRCAFAEQLTSDFRANRGVQTLDATRWSVARADGIEAVYEQTDDCIVRTVAGPSNSRKIYSVGKAVATFPVLEPGKLLRLKFVDTELILSR